MAIAQTVKENPIKSATAVVSLIGAILGIIWGAQGHIVTKSDLNLVKTEIINEMRTESAQIRVAYLHDLESRLEDVEVEMEDLEDSKKSVPEDLRRKAKRLAHRIDEISVGAK